MKMFAIPLVTETMKANHQQKIERIEEQYRMYHRSQAD